MKDIGSQSKDADTKKYPEFAYAGETFSTDYLKKQDGKVKKDVAKIKKTMIKE